MEGRNRFHRARRRRRPGVSECEGFLYRRALPVHKDRKIQATVRAWSDTVTFLVEADVVHTLLTDSIRQAYPSVFGRGMTFTLPLTGQGPSIEAEVNGVEIVFPLGPGLRLSWATCNLQVASNRTRLYSCELKPGYRFR